VDHYEARFQASDSWEGVSKESYYQMISSEYPQAIGEFRKVPPPDPNSGQMRFIIDDALDWFTMQPFLEKHVYVHDFVSPVTDTVDIGAEWVFPHPLTGGSAVFTDTWELVVVSEPESEPEDIKAVTHILPQDATLERFLQIAELTYPRRRTIGFSPHQVRALNVRRNVVAHWDEPESRQQALRDFYAEKDPDIVVRFFPDDSLPPPPPPPPPPAPDPFMLPTYHMQRPFSGWIENVRRLADAGKPLKWVFIVHEGMENIHAIREASPTTKGVYRLVISQREQGDLLLSSDTRTAAYSFWRRFSDSALATKIDAVTSINETIGTGPDAAAERQATVEFDAAFAEIVAQESEIAPVTLLAPPGNPDHGAETEELIPAVIATAANNGYLGPHTYFPCHPGTGISERWMQREGRHYHMRPMLSWYPTFKAAGVTKLPPLLPLETAAVGAYLRADGRPGGFITSGMGWRDAGCLRGDIVRYLQLLLTYVNQVEQWNKDNDYLVECLAIFTQGYVEWEKFQFNREFSQLFSLLLG
jgi:hypothetical protein